MVQECVIKKLLIVTLFYLKKDSGHAGPLLSRRAIDRNSDSKKDGVYMKGSDLLPALFDHTEESLIKQWKDSESQLSSRSDVFTAQKEFIKMKKLLVGFSNAADQHFIAFYPLMRGSASVSEGRSKRGEETRKMEATMRSGEKQTTINEVRPPPASAAIERVSIFNEKIKIRSSPLTQI